MQLKKTFVCKHLSDICPNIGSYWFSIGIGFALKFNIGTGIGSNFGIGTSLVGMYRIVILPDTGYHNPAD